MKHLFHFFLGGGGGGGVPGFVKVFSAFLRSFRAYFWFPVRCSEFSIRCSGFSIRCSGFSIRCSWFSERCSGVFRVFWKLFCDIPSFLKGVPGCSGFSGPVPGVPGCSVVFRCSVFPCSCNYYMPTETVPGA